MKREVEGVNIDCLLWAGIDKAPSRVLWRQHGAGPDAVYRMPLCEFGKAP